MTEIVKRFRVEMAAVTERWAYLNHAAVSPFPRATREAIHRFADGAAMDGTFRWPEWNAAHESLRRLAAAELGADAEEIAIIRSTSEGISIVAAGFPWESGDNVVLFEDEFPSNVYPWLNQSVHGVETRRLPIPELLHYTESVSDATDPVAMEQCGTRIAAALHNRLDEAIDARTRIVAISWVAFRTGFRHDLDAIVELAHRRGALLCVDAIQALGTIPINVRETPVDFLIADGHKWLMGPEGIGVMYIRRNLLDRIRPVCVGWASVAGTRDFDRIDLTWKPDAGRYEHGAPNMIGAAGFHESWKLLAELGVRNIEQAVVGITDHAVEQLRAIGAQIHSVRSASHQSGIVIFSIPDRDPEALQRQCEEDGVVLVRRGAGLRLSPHAYNNTDDIDRLIRAVTR